MDQAIQMHSCTANSRRLVTKSQLPGEPDFSLKYKILD